MTNSNDNVAKEYWYELPAEQIAQAPADPRDSSKLLVYDTTTDTVTLTQFRKLDHFLPSSSQLILNDAKVVPARCILHKKTGGKVVVLFLINEWIHSPAELIPIFTDRKVSVGDSLYFANKETVLVEKQENQLFYVRWLKSKEELLSNLNTFGTMPIPPYIKHTPLTRDELMEKYQTVFAKTPGSSAAPTASLHFTDAVFTRLAKIGIDRAYVTLHVGLGTFAPLTKENLESNSLHKEWIEVPEITSQYIQSAKRNHKTLCAVGTTVVRTLESYALFGLPGKQFAGDTNLFIRPGFQFQLVNSLITNFHLPSSSLMMLVDAFLLHKKAKRRILELYEYAKRNNFRFYSFGDAMLIL